MWHKSSKSNQYEDTSPLQIEGVKSFDGLWRGLRKMLCEEVDQWFSVEQVQRHPWFLNLGETRAPISPLCNLFGVKSSKSKRKLSDLGQGRIYLVGFCIRGSSGYLNRGDEVDIGGYLNRGDEVDIDSYGDGVWLSKKEGRQAASVYCLSS